MDMSVSTLPKFILTDSYKTTHPFLYPDAKKMVAYSEFRSAYGKDTQDQRIVLYGVRYIVQNYLEKPWTQQDLDDAVIFFKTHKATLDGSHTEFPFPKDLFQKMIDENNGYFPVKIQALPEGSVLYPHTPVMQITAEGEYSRLVTYLETILTHIWYPSTVATLSRRCKDLIHKYFLDTVDEEFMGALQSRLHDFGFRGCTSVEQSVIGGCAHLLNFDGTDTMSAAYYAQFKLNNGKPVGSSIPATEHSIMTSFNTEREAMLKLIEKFGDGLAACVMDSYDYANALENVLPTVAAEKLEKGGFLVLRPDSGDPVTVVLDALKAADLVFGHVVNKKGYKVINGASVIQGDGIGYENISEILRKVKEEGYSAMNVAFGMGGGLLQKVNRDTMSMATKLSHITYADGKEREVMKMPKTDLKKVSLPGELVVVKDGLTGTTTVYPLESKTPKKDDMIIVYNGGKKVDWKWESFDQVRARLEREWKTSANHKTHDAISKELRSKIDNVRHKQENKNDQDRTNICLLSQKSEESTLKDRHQAWMVRR
ncbi:NAPRTase-domain-containing protein [Rhizoclosmatium globosum]|uniref:Nicotinamide phosphoribosyltransferase n=1 Tax=Rhizoclosmatium globosum TaxID=329046 RepID=A0A1Y2CL21_9FUNG|nr:NAPRTase-domain-containing protein [Rhizoclosmatium globosum]|eukprot:ORY47722.1 NAPRTase-domain-containing protein [Rhizoclosmatium globosum]